MFPDYILRRPSSGHPVLQALRTAALACCVVAAALADTAGAFLHGLVPPSGADIGGRFPATTHRGETFEVGAPRDRYTLLFFGFTSCPSVCPTTLADARAIVEALGAHAPEVLFVTIDPERDTPAVLASYVGAFHPSFTGAVVDPQAFAHAAAGYRLAHRRVEGERAGGHTFEHSAWLYLLDTAGNVRLMYPYETAPAAVVADLRRLQGLQ